MKYITTGIVWDVIGAWRSGILQLRASLLFFSQYDNSCLRRRDLWIGMYAD